jgi:endonuclease/exonuclease/phosphatase family metal-dependent hydrolase
MSYNICRGGTSREAAIAATIRASEPDLVILQEATRPDVVANLSATTGLTTWAAHRGRSLAVLSKYALAEHHWRRSFWSRHAFLELIVAGFDLRIVGVHLSALHAEWTEERRRLELRAMLGAIRAQAHGFHVVTGATSTRWRPASPSTCTSCRDASGPSSG